MTDKTKDYRVTETLSEGGSTLVCRANRPADGESVLLKILKPDGATKDERARFRREFDIASRLDLPGVAKGLALEDSDKGLAIVFKDIGGQSLDRMLKQGPLSLAYSLEVAIALADTLGSLHKRHIIHKDVKPSHAIVNLTTRRSTLLASGLPMRYPSAVSARCLLRPWKEPLSTFLQSRRVV